MKAITLYEPWAWLIALEQKKIETRSWPTSYRGPIAIHVAKKPVYRQFPMIRQEPFRSALRPLAGLCETCDFDLALSAIDWHHGHVIAVADLVACVEMTPALIAMVDDPERSFGDYEPGRWMWLLEHVRRIDPVPARGRQRLWEWDGPVKYLA